MLYLAMAWTVLQSDEFNEWFKDQSEQTQKDIVVASTVLKEQGPLLGRPIVDHIKGSSFQNMKELRVQSLGQPYRVFFAFDPKRNALFLIGGNKRGDKRFYDKMIPLADKIFRNYLEATDGKK